MRTLEPATRPLAGSLMVPGDKSIAHRALMLGALAEGAQLVYWPPESDDFRATWSVLSTLGARVQSNPAAEGVSVEGPLRAPSEPLACADSGTTMRLLLGLLAGQGIDATLTASAGLSKRPMERVAEPLRRMGALVETTDGKPPVRIRRGSRLRGIEYASPVASAQIKSCLLLAGLGAEGTTTVVEPHLSRDHTERMLGAMGVELERGESGKRVSVRGGQKLHAIEVRVPGDLSSAAFPVVAALLVPGSEVTVEQVGLNPTRAGFLEALERMGADVESVVESTTGGEPVGKIVARGSRELAPIQMSGDLVVRAIDELPALFAAAAFAKGRSVFRDAQELRKKESDRIAEMARGLRALGVSCEELPDGLAVEGDPARRVPGGARVAGAGDHRIVMALACASLGAAGPTAIDGHEAVAKSWPGFFEALAGLSAAGISGKS